MAAGTGKLARQLQAARARCVAVEPSAAMRAQCRSSSPGVAVVAGTAESIPLAGGCADLVSVAQAFHWFSPGPALHELARVLRPDGALVLVWNERDLSPPWAAELESIMRRAGSSPASAGQAQRTAFEGDPHFTPFTRWQGALEVELEPAAVLDMVASRSYVRVMDEPDRAAVLDEVRRLIAPLGPAIRVPYVTTAYCARALPTRCACVEEVPWSG